MTKKSPTIQQSKVTDLMTQLANMPERKKAPGDPVSLSEIFRTREYMAEIKRALKRGYSFDDLAEIFTEKCEIAISARQIRYHYTHGKNQVMKSKSGSGSTESSTPNKHDTSADSPQKTIDEVSGKNSSSTGSGTESFREGTDAVSDGGAELGDFFFGVQSKDW
jgi:hypothetical protein